MTEIMYHNGFDYSNDMGQLQIKNIDMNKYLGDEKIVIKTLENNVLYDEYIKFKSAFNNIIIKLSSDINSIDELVKYINSYKYIKIKNDLSLLSINMSTFYKKHTSWTLQNEDFLDLFSIVLYIVENIDKTNLENK